MSECEPDEHDWVMREGMCETCGGHDHLMCSKCYETIDPYIYTDRDQWTHVLATGRWRNGD